MFNGMKNITSGLLVLAELSTRPDITPLCMNKEEKQRHKSKMAQKNFSGSQLVLNQDPDSHWISSYDQKMSC